MAKKREEIDFSKINIEELHEKYDKVDPEIEQYFTLQELGKMSDYEKERYRNIKRNYLAMNAIGIPYALPDFMKKKPQLPPSSKWTSSESEVGEYIPGEGAGKRTAKVKRTKKREKVVVKKVPKPVQKKKRIPRPKLTKEEQEKLKQLSEAEVKRAAVMQKILDDVVNCSDIADLEIDDIDSVLPDILTCPSPPQSAKDFKGPYFHGFTDRFAEPRIQAIDRAVRHKKKMIKALEKDMNKLKYLKMLDCIDVDEHCLHLDKHGRVIKDKPAPSTRYPRRNIMRVNYSRVEVPSDDEFLYCEDCHQEFQGECPKHGPLNFVPEISNEIDMSLIGTDQYAEHTLLPTLCIKKSRIRAAGAGCGIFTKTKIAKSMVFGPYDGLLTKDAKSAKDTGYAWLIWKNNRPDHYVDGSKKGHSNWMRWVNCACTEDQQNLLAFQFKKEVFYKALRDIEPGEELLVWYGNEYAQELGLEITAPTRSNRKCVSRKEKDSGQVTNIVSSNKQIPVVTEQKGYAETKPDIKPDSTAAVKQSDRINIKQAGPSTSELSAERKLCPQCKLVFKADVIHLHMCGPDSRVNGVDVFQCEDCLLLYTDENFLHKHRHQMHGAVLPLQFYDKKPVLLKDVSQNTENEHGVKVERENYSTTVSSSVADISHGSYQLGGYRCEYCRASFTDVSDRDTHQRTHTDRRYHCQYCGKTLSSSAGRDKHERIHTGERPYKCQFCDKSFGYANVKDKHERTHTGEKPYKCQFCDKSFGRLDHKDTHERTHTGEKPYKCQFCDKSFSHLGDKNKHERTHTGERPYKCQFCDKSFSQSNIKDTHEKTHTGEKPYKCQFCDKSFCGSRELKTHERTHTGERPYKCQFCDESFSYAHVKNAHERIHTGELL